MRSNKSLFTVCILFYILFSISVNTSASEGQNGEVYSEEVEGQVSSEISIPIYIRNNQGLNGYQLKFLYDPEFLTPLSVERGTALSEGNFENDIDSSTFSEGCINVVWNYALEMNDNGLLFTLHCYVKPDASGISLIHAEYDEYNTFNNNFDSISLAIGSIYVKTSVFGNPDFILPKSLSEIEEGAFEGMKAKIVVVPDTCTIINDKAFKDTGIIQIHIPNGCEMRGDVFEGCEMVAVYGASGSEAEEYCRNHTNCIFVEENEAV